MQPRGVGNSSHCRGTGTASHQFLKSDGPRFGTVNLQASWLRREPSFQGNGLASAGAFMFFLSRERLAASRRSSLPLRPWP